MGAGNGEIQLGVLGPVTVRVAGRAPVAISARRHKIRAVLGLLILRANSFLGIEDVVAALWDDPPPSAAANVRTYLTQVRRLLAEPDRALSPRLETVGGALRLRCSPWESDLLRFRQAWHRARECLSEQRLPIAADHYGRALDLWRGPVMAGTPRAGLLEGLCARIDAHRLDATEEAAELHLALDRPPAELVTTLREVVAGHPYRERACACLMVALYRSGNAAAALDEHRSMLRRLRDDLGLAPAPQLQAVQAAILRHDQAALRALWLPRPAAVGSVR